jgi:hypothetical protein
MRFSRGSLSPLSLSGKEKSFRIMTANIEERQDLPQIKQVDAILALTKGSPINISYALLKTLESAHSEDQPALLRYIAEHFGITETSDEIPIDVFITADELSALKTQYSKVVDSMFDMILQDRPSAVCFYSALNSMIVHNSVFTDEKSRAFAMYWILIDKRIPYFELGQGLKLANEEWQAISRKLTLEKQKARFILASDFSQKSEEADLLLKELDSKEDQERVYLLGFILHLLRDAANRSASQS